MKANELKQKLEKSAIELINVYYNDNTLIDKLTNSTLKAILKANMTKIDGVLDLFTDNEGNIDAESILSCYAEQIGDGLELDIKQYIKSDFICNLLPNKVLIISKDDILKIIKDETKLQQLIPIKLQNDNE